MSLSEPKRKVDEEETVSRKMDFAVFFVEFNGNATCLISKEVPVLKEYNLKHQYTSKRGEQSDKLQEDERKNMQLQRDLTSQQNLFFKPKRMLMLPLKQVMW